MNALIKGCKAEKCNSITLEVRESNVPALKLYEKLGFKAAGKRKKYYSDNNVQNTPLSYAPYNHSI